MVTIVFILSGLFFSGFLGYLIEFGYTKKKMPLKYAKLFGLLFLIQVSLGLGIIPDEAILTEKAFPETSMAIAKFPQGNFIEHIRKVIPKLLKIRQIMQLQFKKSAIRQDIGSFLLELKHKKRTDFNAQSYITWIRHLRKQIQHSSVQPKLDDLKWQLDSLLMEIDILFVSYLQHLNKIRNRTPFSEVEKRVNYKLERTYAMLSVHNKD